MVKVRIGDVSISLRHSGEGRNIGRCETCSSIEDTDSSSGKNSNPSENISHIKKLKNTVDVDNDKTES